MTIHQAKADTKSRLENAGVCFTKITARTVDLSDLARATPIFVTVHGARYRSTGDVLKAAVFADVPKPSQGGYIVNFNGCFWNGSTAACASIIS